MAKHALRLRWVAVAVFVLSSTLNYLDRGLMAAFGPEILREFGASFTAFGWIVSAFSLAYACSSLFAGWFIDRAGLNRAITVALGLWCCAAVTSGFAPSLLFLGICRAFLGIGESAGVPSTGKLNAIYLKPEERALGAAVNQIGLSLGTMLVPAVAALDGKFTWRFWIICTGAAGLLWIPLWAFLSRRIPPAFGTREADPGARSWQLLRNRTLWLVVIANVFWMGSYSLWSNWSFIYLQSVYKLSTRQAAAYLWIPALISNAGGFFGGWLSFRWMKHRSGAVSARRRAIWFAAFGSLLTLLLPLAATPAWATACISASYFFALAGSVNIYALPIDLFGAAQSGMAIAALTCAFGLLQTVISPLIGFLAQRHLYADVCWLVTVPLFAAGLTLQLIRTPATARLPQPDLRPAAG